MQAQAQAQAQAWARARAQAQPWEGLGNLLLVEFGEEAGPCSEAGWGNHLQALPQESLSTVHQTEASQVHPIQHLHTPTTAMPAAAYACRSLLACMPLLACLHLLRVAAYKHQSPGHVIFQ